jgi:hypothetical protein
VHLSILFFMATHTSSFLESSASICDFSATASHCCSSITAAASPRRSSKSRSCLFRLCSLGQSPLQNGDDSKVYQANRSVHLYPVILGKKYFTWMQQPMCRWSLTKHKLLN